MMSASIEISIAIRQEIVEAALSAHPQEACGILIGASTAGAFSVSEMRVAANLSPTPLVHYFIAPADLLAAERRGKELRREVIGYWHSHPYSPAIPSARDLAEAWELYVYLIYSVSEGSLRAWQIPSRGEPFHELPLLTP